MQALYRCIAGMDASIECCTSSRFWSSGQTAPKKSTSALLALQRDRRALVAWLVELGVELVVMESTGIYWKSIYSTLEKAGIPAHVVNARHVKNVPGRKTDLSDSEWLARLGRYGLVKPSFIPPEDLRELRVVSRYRDKVAQTLAGEKNRLHKVLDDAGSNSARSSRTSMASPPKP